MIPHRFCYYTVCIQVRLSVLWIDYLRIRTNKDLRRRYLKTIHPSPHLLYDGNKFLQEIMGAMYGTATPQQWHNGRKQGYIRIYTRLGIT